MEKLKLRIKEHPILEMKEKAEITLHVYGKE